MLQRGKQEDESGPLTLATMHDLCFPFSWQTPCVSDPQTLVKCMSLPCWCANDIYNTEVKLRAKYHPKRQIPNLLQATQNLCPNMKRLIDGSSFQAAKHTSKPHITVVWGWQTVSEVWFPVQAPIRPSHTPTLWVCDLACELTPTALSSALFILKPTIY